MPFRSEKQRKFMYGVAEGKIKRPDAPSREVARRFIDHSRRYERQSTDRQN